MLEKLKAALSRMPSYISHAFPKDIRDVLLEMAAIIDRQDKEINEMAEMIVESSKCALEMAAEIENPRGNK